MTRYAFGQGDGAITPDGCAVELYRSLKPGKEAELIARLLSPGARILDLGAGAGRLTHVLLAAGFEVTAVDHSPEMLAEISGAECVCAPIEELDLKEQRFDGVLLASYLLNAPDPAARASLLATCRRHVAPEGAVILQVRGPSILQDRTGFEREQDDVRDSVEAYVREGRRVTMTWRTEAHGRRWIQTFTHEYLDEDQLRSELGFAGLRFEGWIDSPEWLVAKVGAE